MELKTKHPGDRGKNLGFVELEVTLWLSLILFIVYQYFSFYQSGRSVQEELITKFQDKRDKRI